MERRRMDCAIQEQLIAAALAVRGKAYAPFSRFLVGAALVTEDHQFFVGCNIENASYGATICAERVAGGTAIAAGKRAWIGLAVATTGGASPCGVCRQFLAEFAPEMPVLMIDVETGEMRSKTVAELLPDRFIFSGP